MELIVNAATSADGKLSSVRREQIAISGPDDFARVDRLRRSVDAILVGIGTVLADDPSLTVEDPEAAENDLVRVVVDSGGRTPADARVLEGDAPTIIATADTAPERRIRELEAAGATVLSHGTDRVDIAATVDALADRGIRSLLVEGGGEIVFSCFDAGLVDRLLVYIGPVVIGGRDAPTLVDGTGFVRPETFPTLTLEGIERIDDGALLEWAVDGEGGATRENAVDAG